jgi:hypothetical protein
VTMMAGDEADLHDQSLGRHSMKAHEQPGPSYAPSSCHSENTKSWPILIAIVRHSTPRNRMSKGGWDAAKKAGDG